MNALNLIWIVLSVGTIAHMWLRVNIKFFLKLIITIAFFIVPFAFIIYWIWFFIKKTDIKNNVGNEDEKNGEVKEPDAKFLTNVGQKCTYEQTIWFYDHVAENFPTEELRDKYFNLFINFMTNPTLSVDEKLKILEIHDEKLRGIYPNDTLEKGMLYIDGLLACYNLYEYILGEDLKILVHSDKSELSKDIEEGTIVNKPMTKYLQPIFAHSALIRGKQEEFNINTSIWSKYNIPKFTE